MTTTYALQNSALKPQDVAPLFTDAASYLAMSGATLQTRILLGTRYYFMATVAITDDAGPGWTATKTVILAALNDGFAAIVPTVITAAAVVGTRKVGCTLMCVGGRADGWVSPYWTYQWLRGGAAISGATRWVYTLTAADLGAVVECRQTWTNVGGSVSSTSTGGAATAAAAIVAPAGSVRYVGPNAAGTGAGTSWANRMAIASLSLAITQAGPGGEVLIAADLGTYSPNGVQIFDGGTDDTNRVTIRGVNSVTGADQKAVMQGGRAAFNDVGRYMTRTGSSGVQLFSLRPGNTTFTANAGTDVLTLASATVGSALETDDPVQVKTTGTLPGGLVAVTTYYVIAVTSTTIKLAATAGGAAIDITSAGSGTHTVTAWGIDVAFSADAATDQITVPAAFYADTFDGDVVQVYNGTGTLPAGLVSLNQYLVKKISANVIKLCNNNTGLRNASYINITDAGSGAFRMWRIQAKRGPHWLTWKFLQIINAGSGSGAFGLATSNRGNTFEDIDASNVYRLFDNTHYTGATSTFDASVNEVTVKRCHVFGAERGFWRLRHASRNGLCQDCSCDSARYAKDPYTSIFSLESQNVGNMFNGPSNMHYLRCCAQRAYQDAGSGQYWNGDGFEDNQASTGNHYENCESGWNNDAGYDCKAIDDLFTNCLAAFNKRNYRLWGYGVVLNDCYSLQPQRAGEAFGENGGSLHVWQGRDNASCTINRMIVREGGSTQAFYQDDYNGMTMIVNQTDYHGRTGSPLTHPGGSGNTMTINP